MIRQSTQEDVKNGLFDPINIIETHPAEYRMPEIKKSVLVRERGYIASELSTLFRLAGFEVEHIWGGTAGDWGRRQVELDEIEIMIIAKKPSDTAP